MRLKNIHSCFLMEFSPQTLCAFGLKIVFLAVSGGLVPQKCLGNLRIWLFLNSFEGTRGPQALRRWQCGCAVLIPAELSEGIAGTCKVQNCTEQMAGASKAKTHLER